MYYVLLILTYLEDGVIMVILLRIAFFRCSFPFFFQLCKCTMC